MNRTKRRWALFFAWYDIWVGVYYDRKQQIVYIMPFPTLGVWFRLGRVAK